MNTSREASDKIEATLIAFTHNTIAHYQALKTINFLELRVDGETITLDKGKLKGLFLSSFGKDTTTRYYNTYFKHRC